MNNKIKISDKRLVNCDADVNQLHPIKYHFARNSFIKATANNWMPQEVSMTADVADWKHNKDVTDDIRSMVKLNLGFFATAESLVANNIAFSIYKHITNPECRQYLIRQLYEESIHTETFLYIIEALGINADDTYNLYNSQQSVKDKAAWSIKHTKDLDDPEFKTDTKEKLHRFILNLNALYVVQESLFFFTGFAQILSLGRRNMFRGIATQYAYTMRDESLHFNFGIALIKQIIAENQHWITDDLYKDMEQQIQDGIELEAAYAKEVLPEDGIYGVSPQSVRAYMEFSANERRKALGLPVVARKYKNPFVWLDEVIEIDKERNFFETRVIEYQTGGSLTWD